MGYRDRRGLSRQTPGAAVSQASRGWAQDEQDEQDQRRGRTGRRSFGRVDAADVAADAFRRVARVIERLPEVSKPQAWADLADVLGEYAEQLEQAVSRRRSTRPAMRRRQGW